MEDQEFLADGIEKIMARIGYGRYQAVVALTVILLEYAQGCEIIVIGIFEKYLINETELSDTIISLLCTFMGFGFTIGLISSLVVTNTLGRVSILKISYGLSISTALISAFTKNIVAFFLIRTVTNFAIGLGAPIVFTYFIESSPSYNRGYFSVSVDFMYNFGQLVVLGATYFLMPDIDGDNWFIVMCFPYLLLIIPSFFLFFYLKESPWNLANTKNTEELITALEFISYENTTTHLTEEEKEIAREFHADEASFLESLKILMDKKHLGTILKLAWIRICLLVGYVGVIYFIPFLFNSDTFYLSYLVCIVSNVPFMIIISLVIEHNYFGRRNTLLISMCTLTGLSGSMIIFQGHDIILAIIIGSICGLASVTTTVNALFVVELHETNIRVASISVTHFVGRIQLLYIVSVLVILTKQPVLLFICFTALYASGALSTFFIKHDTRGKELDSEYIDE